MHKLVAFVVSPLVSASVAFAAPGVTTTGVNFREGPGTNYTSMEVLPAGTAIEIDGCDDGVWCAVTVGDVTGFVSGNYITEVALPVDEPEGVDVVEPNGDVDGPNDDLLSEEQLDTLVAPIALYPDSLLAQVLVASTAPLDIVKAQRWVEENADLPTEDREGAVEQQDWDDSVKVLAAGFPQVITTMANDLDWTENLGDAVIIQNDDVLDAVQRQRARAQAVGNLESNDAQVIQNVDNSIVIESAEPERVYVPQYNPQTVYVEAAPEPVYVETSSGWNDAAAILATGAIAFGIGYGVNEIFRGGYRDYWYGPTRINYNTYNIYPRPGRPPHRPGRPGRPGWDRPDRPDRPGRPGRPGAGPNRPGASPWKPTPRQKQRARRRVKDERGNQRRGNRVDRPRQGQGGDRPRQGNRGDRPRQGQGSGRPNRAANMESKLKQRSNRQGGKPSRPANRSNAAPSRRAGAKSGAVSRPKKSSTQARKNANRGKASNRKRTTRQSSRPQQRVSRSRGSSQARRKAGNNRSAFNRSRASPRRKSASRSRGRSSRGRRGGGRKRR